MSNITEQALPEDNRRTILSLTDFASLVATPPEEVFHPFLSTEIRQGGHEVSPISLSQDAIPFGFASFLIEIIRTMALTAVEEFVRSLFPKSGQSLDALLERITQAFTAIVWRALERIEEGRIQEGLRQASVRIGFARDRLAMYGTTGELVYLQDAERAAAYAGEDFQSMGTPGFGGLLIAGTVHVKCLALLNQKKRSLAPKVTVEGTVGKYIAYLHTQTSLIENAIRQIKVGGYPTEAGLAIHDWPPTDLGEPGAPETRLADIQRNRYIIASFGSPSWGFAVALTRPDPYNPPSFVHVIDQKYVRALKSDNFTAFFDLVKNVRSMEAITEKNLKADASKEYFEPAALAITEWKSTAGKAHDDQ